MTDFENTTMYQDVLLVKVFTFAVELYGKEPKRLAHLLRTSALVMENNGDRHQVAAALLYSVVRDNEEICVYEIHELFGGRVADIVLDCTSESPEEFIENMRNAEPYSILVAVAVNLDEIRNAQSLDRKAVDFYSQLLPIYEQHRPDCPMIREMRELLTPSRYVALNSTAVIYESQEVDSGVICDFDDDGNVIGIEILKRVTL